jgi:hypothetical protein
MEPPQKVQRTDDDMEFQRTDQRWRTAVYLIIGHLDGDPIDRETEEAIMEVDEILSHVWDQPTSVIVSTVHEQYFGGDPAVSAMEIENALDLGCQ